MATISAYSISTSHFKSHPSAFSPSQIRPQCVRIHGRNVFSSIAVSSMKKCDRSRRPTIIRSVAEGEQEVVPETEAEQAEASPAIDQAVSVPVSPSDVLTMFFQAEGTMNDSSVPGVTKALEDVEGITDLKVQVLEGIASVELTKQTTVQATGVASNLVEIIQGSGFKLQTLNLSFLDDEDTS